MVMKYIILANSNDKTFNIPRQLVEINGERLIERTIRLLKENGINDIIITASDKRFDNFGAKRYEPLNSDYNYEKGTGYWLNAFPFELMNEPICFIWGDVYFSEEAIKIIVNTPTDSTLFFCTCNNKSPMYIKHHDEPLAYKIVDTELFKKHINRVKRLYDEGKTIRHPIVWEVYRSINNQDINEHIMTDNFVAINDISCDIDTLKDLELLKIKIGGEKMIKVEVIENFSLQDFNKLEDLQRATSKNEKGKLYVRDTFKCDDKMVDYLMGNNPLNKAVVKVVEVKPEEEIEPLTNEEEIEKIKEEVEQEEKPKKKKTTKKK